MRASPGTQGASCACVKGQGAGEGDKEEAGIAAGNGIVKVKAARWQQKAQKAPPSSPSPSSKLPQNLLLLFYINSKCAKIKQTKCCARAGAKGEAAGDGLGAWQAVFMPLAIE